MRWRPRLAADWGTVATGKVADLVPLSANPLANISNTRSVKAVVADGRVYAPESLDGLRLRILELVNK